MKDDAKNNDKLLEEISGLKEQLFEANAIIDAIRDGSVDALVLNKNGRAQVYSIESADYTYRILIEKFGEGALSISEDGLILYCNDYFSKLIGLASDAITGTFFESYMDDPSVFLKLTSELKMGSSKGEIILNARYGKLHAYVSLSDLRPNVAAIGVVVTDLTEKQKHEEALVQYQNQLEFKVNELAATNKNLEQFIHVVSHDIKEPLRKILTYSSHLSESHEKLFTERELKNLNIINSSALRLNSLVDDLVKYAFSATEDEKQEVDLNKIIGEVMDDLELVIAENKAKILFTALPKVMASKIQMRQLFANLISNAIKYGKSGIPPQIEILSSAIPNSDPHYNSEKWLKITLKDNGIGMEKSHLDKIFTIFQRLHLRNEYSGNGIGLAICKKIMENHHGKIEVESEINKGSAFHLYFPITQ